MPLEIARNRYVAENLTAEKSRDVNPEVVLCDDCVEDHRIAFKIGNSSDSCEACGHPHY